MEGENGNGDEVVAGPCLSGFVDDGSTESHRYFLSRRTVLEMLRDRGYSVPSSEIDLSLQDFRSLHGQNPGADRLRFSTVHSSDPSERMLVIYCGPGIVKVNVIRGLHSQIANKDTLSGLILILQSQITSQALKTLDLYPFKVEIFQITDLLINITKHVLKPQHQVLTEQAKQALLKKFNIEEKQLPRISQKDAIAKYYGLERGQVVKVTYSETSREPCPDRILDDVGGAFGMGAVGGGAFHFIKGIYNSPKGARLVGAAQAVRMNSPRVGGSFAVWGGLFSTFDCTMVYLRQKEDPWNSIIAGAATGGFLSMRQGMGATARSAAMGGVLLALIEGAGIMLNKMMEKQQQIPMEEPGLVGLPGMMGGPEEPVGSEGPGSWLGGLFGKGKEPEPATSGSETKVLESFDAPPVPNFDYNLSSLMHSVNAIKIFHSFIRLGEGEEDSLFKFSRFAPLCSLS
ncbi:hypothetical protein ACLB2K_063309 [Fragaria x ananassa]